MMRCIKRFLDRILKRENREKKIPPGKFRCPGDLPDLDIWERAAIAFINGERLQVNSRPLLICGELCESAGWVAEQMAEYSECSHRFFINEVRPDLERLYPGVRVNEVAARQQLTPGKLISAWMASDSHRRAILFSRYRYIGFSYEINSRGALYAVAHLCY